MFTKILSTLKFSTPYLLLQIQVHKLEFSTCVTQQILSLLPLIYHTAQGLWPKIAWYHFHRTENCNWTVPCVGKRSDLVACAMATGADPGFWSGGPCGVLTPGEETWAQFAQNRGFFPLKLLKTAWFRKNLGVGGGPLDPLVGQCTRFVKTEVVRCQSKRVSHCAFCTFSWRRRNTVTSQTLAKLAKKRWNTAFTLHSTNTSGANVFLYIFHLN